MTVEIDRNSGFCGGVIRAIDGAERILAEGGVLFSLGAVVHNESELARLRSRGLVTVSLDDISSSSSAPAPESLSGSRKKASPDKAPVSGDAKTLLIRAHGEPPQTYRIAREMGWEVVDFTCPVVLNIQKSIREARAAKGNGQIVIFGKIGHAEVLGLVGQVGGDATVVESLSQLQEAVASGKIDLQRPVDIFSQTTKSPVEYEQICGYLSAQMEGTSLLTIHNTICRQVASRHKELSEFARSHDVVVFVSGRESSNGRVLSDLCKSVNPRTYRVENASELDPSWFRPDDNVGVCGATSTPKWLLEEVAGQIKNLH